MTFRLLPLPSVTFYGFINKVLPQMTSQPKGAKGKKLKKFGKELPLQNHEQLDNLKTSYSANF